MQWDKVSVLRLKGTLEGWFCLLEPERLKGRVPYKGNGLKNGLKCSSFFFWGVLKLSCHRKLEDGDEKMEDKECEVE